MRPRAARERGRRPPDRPGADRLRARPARRRRRTPCSCPARSERGGASSAPSMPHASDGSSPQPGSPGVRPARSAASCGSSPCLTYAARSPRTRKRGLGWAATRLIQRCDRSPDTCSSARKTSSSTSRARASRVDLRVHELGWAEELERLVDEMRAEVEEQPARLGWLLAPGARELRPPAVDPRLEAVHGAERALADELPHRQEVAVPAAVLEHGQHEAALVGGVDEPPCLLGRRRERLVDDDREPDLERGQRIGHVEAVRRRHHDEVEVAGPLEHVLRAVEHEHAGIPLLRAPPPFGVASRDGGELEAFGRRDVRRVEHRPGEAVTEERNAKRHESSPASCFSRPSRSTLESRDEGADGGDHRRRHCGKERPGARLRTASACNRERASRRRGARDALRDQRRAACRSVLQAGVRQGAARPVVPGDNGAHQPQTARRRARARRGADAARGGGAPPGDHRRVHRADAGALESGLLRARRATRRRTASCAASSPSATTCRSTCGAGSSPSRRPTARGCASPGPGPYITPDIDDVGFMSMSIKLMGVPGPKLLEDEQHTQDFLGVSPPTFVTPDTRAERAPAVLESPQRCDLLLPRSARLARPRLDHAAALDEDADEPAREPVLQLRAVPARRGPGDAVRDAQPPEGAEPRARACPGVLPTTTCATPW